MLSLSISLLLVFSTSCREEKPSENKFKTKETQQINLSLPVIDTGTKLKYTSGIRAILEDSQGNYWFGSHEEGVCKFDGNSFEYFTQGNGLSDNQVRSIQEDENGVIWFGTAAGVSSYQEGKIKNHVIQYKFNHPVLPVTNNWTLHEKDLWFNAGNSPGVLKYDGKEVSYFEFPVQMDAASPNQYSNTGFSKGKEGNIWFATYSAVIGYNGSKFEVIDNASLGFNEQTKWLHVRSILEDSKGNLWIGNNGIGLLLKKEDSIVNFSKQNGLVHANSSGGGARSPAGTLEHIFAIHEDSQGNIWFGDRDTGVWKYDGEAFTNYTVDKALKSQMVWDIYEDQKLNLLFGMADGGVYVFNGSSFDRKY